MRGEPAGATLAVAIMLILAGCSGGLVSSDSAPSPTPAPVPTLESTATHAPQVAPGLAADGVRNTSVLFAAHQAALANRSFTKVTTLTVTYPNGTTYYRQVTRTTVANDSALTVGERTGIRALQFNPAIIVKYKIYYTGDTRVSRVVLRSGTVRNLRHLPSDLPDAAALPLVERRLRVADHRVVRRGARHVLLAGDLPWPAFRNPAFLSSPRNVTSRTVVAPDGLILESRVRYRALVDGQEVQVRRNVRFEHIGETTVERPAWLKSNRTDSPTSTPDPTPTATSG